MPAIQLTGLASGMDTGAIIDQLMAVEKQPRTNITLKQDATTKRQSLLTDIQTKLTALKTANDDLKSSLTWLDTQTTTSSDESKMTAIRTAGAPPGSYDIAVTQMASAERQTYAFASPAADGPMTILNADGTTRASIDLKAGASVDDAVSAINGNSSSGLYAVNVNGSLVLASKTTGSGSGFSVGGVGTNTETVAGKDAQFTIDGKAYTSQTNTIENALPGVTLTLKGKTSADNPLSLTVGTPAPDADAIVKKVQAFVTAYNDLVTTTRGDVTEKPVNGATTTEDAQKGTLFGDTGLTDMLSSMRTVLSTPVAGMSGKLTSLADLGITTGAAVGSGTVSQDSLDGKLTVDADKLKDALTTNPQAAEQILGGYAFSKSQPGVPQAFDAVLKTYAGTGGLIAGRIDSATSDLADLANRLDAFDMSMDSKQAYYEAQFQQLETAMAASQSSGASLNGLIASSTA